MKKIINHLHAEWYKYVLEILVLVIGIYGAFALESWRDNTARKKEELEILKGCKTELTADLKEIANNTGELKQSIRSLGILKKAIENDLPYHDSLAFHFNYTLLPMHFVHSTSTFETLRSKGLDIISNDSLRSQLITLYDSQYEFFIQAETEELDYVHYCLKYMLPGRFEAGWNFSDDSIGSFYGKMVPLDFESLKTDTEYLYFINTQLNRTKSYLGYFYQNLETSVASMLDAIEKELNRIQG